METHLLDSKYRGRPAGRPAPSHRTSHGTPRDVPRGDVPRGDVPRSDVPRRPATSRFTRQEKNFSTKMILVMIYDFCRRFSETEEKISAKMILVMIYDFYRSKSSPGRPPANSSSSSRSRKKFGSPQLQQNPRAQLRSRARQVHEDETEIDFPVGVPKGLTPSTSNMYNMCVYTPVRIHMYHIYIILFTLRGTQTELVECPIPPPWARLCTSPLRCTQNLAHNHAHAFTRLANFLSSV